MCICTNILNSVSTELIYAADINKIQHEIFKIKDY